MVVANVMPPPFSPFPPQGGSSAVQHRGGGGATTQLGPQRRCTCSAGLETRKAPHHRPTAPPRPLLPRSFSSSSQTAVKASRASRVRMPCGPSATSLTKLATISHTIGLMSTPNAGGTTPRVNASRGSVGQATKLKGASFRSMLGYQESTIRASMAKLKTAKKGPNTVDVGSTHAGTSALATVGARRAAENSADPMLYFLWDSTSTSRAILKEEGLVHPD
mmetsp:Transcript_68113/g.156302  ORF Transcript_68113/g.156302 Transcript_68113/m.156302 type:complete len:220 (-) Transcript_68113:117-776(-)